MYLRANSGHGQRKGHGACEKDEANKSAFLLGHFFDDVEPMLESPTLNYSVKGNKVLVAVKFRPGSNEESGRIWWMYDRGPDGSAAYISEIIPEDQWKDMKYDAKKKVWTAEIDIKKGASHIDLFSNHRKTIRYQSKDYKTYLSSPYTRIALESAREK